VGKQQPTSHSAPLNAHTLTHLNTTSCHQKFLDAFLGAAKIEHVMPRVEIVREGDLVNDVSACAGVVGGGARG